MGAQLGEGNTPTDPRGGFKHKPDFDLIRMLDGHVITDPNEMEIDRNCYDPYASDQGDHDD